MLFQFLTHESYGKFGDEDYCFEQYEQEADSLENAIAILFKNWSLYQLGRVYKIYTIIDNKFYSCENEFEKFHKKARAEFEKFKLASQEYEEYLRLKEKFEVELNADSFD